MRELNPPSRFRQSAALIIALAVNGTSPEIAEAVFARQAVAGGGTCDTDDCPPEENRGEKTAGFSHGTASAQAWILHESVTKFPTEVTPEQDAGPHHLRVNASASYNNHLGGANASASASMFDKVTAFAHADEIDIFGSAIVSVRLTGQLSTSGDGIASFNAEFVAPSYDESPLEGEITFAERFYFVANGDSYAVNEQLVLGMQDPFSWFAAGIDVALQIQVHAGAHVGSATANFTGTMKVESFTFLDKNGNMMDGVTVVGDSGTNYPVNVPVPEPSTLLLFGIGAISLLGYRKAKSHG